MKLANKKAIKLKMHILISEFLKVTLASKILFKI